MKRIIYVAGVNRKHIAAATQSVPYWLLSATLLRKYPSWIDQYLTRDRKVIWDPGTVTDDCISYHRFRFFVDRYVKSRHRYLQYDEIGDVEATSWYLKDMRRRGYRPIPVIQGRDMYYLLRQEPIVAIGGLLSMSDDKRRKHLDEIFYDYKPTARIHLLGMIKHEWFEPYETAVQGDNTNHIPRSAWNRKKSIEQWMTEYGEQWIPYKPRELVQIAMGF